MDDYDILDEVRKLTAQGPDPNAKLIAYLKTAPWVRAIHRARVSAQYWLVLDYFYWNPDESVVVAPRNVPLEPAYSYPSDTELALWTVEREPCGCPIPPNDYKSVQQVTSITGDRITCTSNGITYTNVALWVPLSDHAIWDWNASSDEKHPYDTFVTEFLNLK